MIWARVSAERKLERRETEEGLVLLGESVRSGLPFIRSISSVLDHIGSPSFAAGWT